MKQFTKQRNERIRNDYRKLVEHYKRAGERRPGQQAIQDLVHQYSAFEFTHETLQQIISNANYGQPEKAKKKPGRKRVVEKQEVPVPATTPEDVPAEPSTESGD